MLRAWAVLAAFAFLGTICTGYAQTTRLLISSGMSVPGHADLTFGSFSAVSMNSANDLVFLCTLRGNQSEVQAVVRSSGESFSVVAIEGLASPIPKTTYASLGVPSMNGTGIIAFTTGLEGGAGGSAIIRVMSGFAQAIVVSGANVPQLPDATFAEFSAPLVNSAGNVLFAARMEGKNPGTGLFLWTPQGIQSLAVPDTLALKANDLLVPFYFSHDEAAFVVRGVSKEMATDQLFRALAVNSFQEQNLPPAPSDTTVLLPPHPNEPPIKMLLALMEGQDVRMTTLVGDPNQSVLVKQKLGTPRRPVEQIWGQTGETNGNTIFAATTADTNRRLVLYRLANAEVVPLTQPGELLPILQADPTNPILSLTSGSQHVAAFIGASAQGGISTAIYITALP